MSTIAHVNNVHAPDSQQQNAGSDDGVSNNSTDFATYPKKVNLTDINVIIEEVEEILAANPELPRLSRSEILEILDNMTSTIPEKESISAGVSHTGHYNSREEYLRAMRALMLVLPYNAKNLSESKIQELYTKAPIIRIIEDSSEAATTVKTKTKPSPAVTLLTSTTVEPQQTKYTNHEIYHQSHDSHHNYESETKAPQTTTTLTKKQNSTTKRHHHRRRRPTTTTTLQTPGSYEYQFVNEHYETTKLSSGEQTVTTVYPQRTSDYNTRDQNYQSSKAVTVQEIVTTVYPERTNFQEGIISPNYISQDYNVHLHSPLQNKTKHYNGLQPNDSQQRIKPVSTANVNETQSSMEVTGIGFDLPSDMKQLLTSFSVDDHLSNHRVHNTSKEIMPLATSEKGGSFPELPKYSSQYSASELVFERTTTQKPVMRDDVKEILESIGLFPNKESQDGVTETPSTTATTATTTATPDVAAAAESLSSEMKDLLISFGLLPSANDIQQGSESVSAGYVASPVVDPISYVSFKPLPITTNHNKEDKEDKQLMSSDMKEFLASFGLISTSDSDEGYSGTGSFSEHGSVRRFRSQKAVTMDTQPSANNSSNVTTNKPDLSSNVTMPHISTDMLTDEMKDILENLGFLPFSNLSMRKTNPVEGHIFNPSSHLASLHPTKEEAQRLTKLLDTIKKLMKENGTVTQDEIDALNESISIILPPATVKHDKKASHSANDLSNVLPVLFVQKNKSVPLDHIKDAPDPLSLEELLLVTDDNKNEVKRQQSSNGTTTEATNQDKGPSLTDLADSFGGSTGTTPGEDSVSDMLPTKKPNGLYFLLDWNTFLDVGEEGNSRRVNLRFNPRLGNRRDFLPVTVP